MSYATQLRNGVLAAVVCMSAVGTPASAVEMFTYFGDGSYIGLPSLEVPIEAYPGIPLRSDRLRAQRHGRPAPRGTVGRFHGRGITIRVPVQQPTPAPRHPPMPKPIPQEDPAAHDEPTSVDEGAPSVIAPKEADSAALSNTLEADPFAASRKQNRSTSFPRGTELDFGGLRELSAYEQSVLPQ